LDLLFNAIKEDYSMSRVQAFLKRLLQISIHAEPPFIIATLLLVQKIFELHPGTRSLLAYSQHGRILEEEEDEHFEDAPDPDDEVKVEKKKPEPKQAPKAEGTEPEKKSFSKEYDPFKREPLYANADNTLLYELLVLKNHYHPTVKLYTNAIINNERSDKIFDYNGNPLIDYSLSNFLDRIAFKKPKKVSESKQSKMRMSKLSQPISETVPLWLS
jgi:ribosome biogenesis protein MAK21